MVTRVFSSANNGTKLTTDFYHLLSFFIIYINFPQAGHHEYPLQSGTQKDLQVVSTSRNERQNIW